MKVSKNKLYFKEGENGVFDITNLTGVGPDKLHEIIISLTNRDMYVSKKPEEMNSKFGFLYISGYQGGKIINDFYRIVFDNKDYVSSIMKDYAEK